VFDRSSQVLNRLDRFLRDHVPHDLYLDTAPVEVVGWEVPDEPVSFETARDADYVPVAIGSPWGRPWGTTWFRVRGEVPASWADVAGATPELVVDLGFRPLQVGFQAEALAWRPDGTAIKAIEPENRWLRVGDPGESFEVFLEAASNPHVTSEGLVHPTPLGDKQTAGTGPIYRLQRLDLGLRDLAVWELVADIEALRGLAGQLPDSTRRSEIIAALSAMMDAVDWDDLHASAPTARRVLAPMLDRPASASAHTVHAVGHAHIDSAWLWPIRETIRKCARTFSNVLDLIDADPDVTFACSSAQQYQWMKDHYPDVWARMRTAVAAGRFVPVGGMWVESDINLTGGEALVRQFLVGTRFFLDEFGVESEEVWLPDTFGYSAAVPQIARLAGKKYFLTQKMSWNDTNRFPHHTFWWEGLDGTRIFTHFPPVDTYNATLSAEELLRAEHTFAERGGATVSLAPYGSATGVADRLARCCSRRAGSPTSRGRRGSNCRARSGSSRRRSPNTPTPPCGAVRCTSNCTVAPTPASTGQRPATGATSTCSERPNCGPPQRPCAPERPTRGRHSTGCGARFCCSSSTTSSPARRSPGCIRRRRRPTPRSPRSLSS